jgi:SAM-dependent methyltransferase
MTTPPGHPGATPEEPLAESAPLARELAATHCRPLPSLAGGCAWYHGFWQDLRRLGIAKTSGGQGAFLVDTLRSLARAGESPRVLVSGSADYSMPAHALAAYRAEGARLQLTVVDRCETPLALCRWYASREEAARHGAALSTYRADILAHVGPEPVDVVFTNSFLGSFAPADRPRLAAAWHRLLRPGGRLAFTNRLRPGAGTGPLGFEAEQARGFVEAARREAAARRDALGLDPEETAQRAQAYAERYRSHPVRSADEIAELLDRGGFSVDRLEVTTNPGRPGGAVSGPSTAERADYARVLATRR